MIVARRPGEHLWAHRRQRVRAAKVCVALCLVVLSGCATYQAPHAVENTELRARALSQEGGDVRVRAAVLSAAGSLERFGFDVNAAGIQPVWVEVHNEGPDTLWLLHAGADPDYFSPLEVAWSFHSILGESSNAAIDEHFDALAFRNPIPPGSTRAGFLFTNPHYRTRVLNIDLLGRHRMVPFTLFLPVPNRPKDAAVLPIVARYTGAAQQDFETPDAFRAALERLPCCAANTRRSEPGNPLNIVLVGEFDHIAAAMVRRGLRLDRRAIDDIQQVFGRRPDIVGRKIGQTTVSPHWVRLWVAPFRYRNQPVLVGQTGRPMGGRLATADDQHPVLHPNVDEVRDFFIQDLLYSGGLAKLGFVEGAGEVNAAAEPREIAAGSRYYTDGFRAVMFFVSRPRSLSDVEILDWVPALKLREEKAAAELVSETP